MPMTHAPETGTENPYQKACTGFLQVCHANRYRFFWVPKSGTESLGAGNRDQMTTDEY